MGAGGGPDGEGAGCAEPRGAGAPRLGEPVLLFLHALQPAGRLPSCSPVCLIRSFTRFLLIGKRPFFPPKKNKPFIISAINVFHFVIRLLILPKNFI